MTRNSKGLPSPNREAHQCNLARPILVRLPPSIAWDRLPRWRPPSFDTDVTARVGEIRKRFDTIFATVVIHQFVSQDADQPCLFRRVTGESIVTTNGTQESFLDQLLGDFRTLNATQSVGVKHVTMSRQPVHSPRDIQIANGIRLIIVRLVKSSEAGREKSQDLSADCIAMDKTFTDPPSARHFLAEPHFHLLSRCAGDCDRAGFRSRWPT